MNNYNLFTFVIPATSYHISVKTGDERSAGTDANVFIKLFGKDGDTGMLPLKQAENNKNKFERGRTDKFIVEAVDFGKVCSCDSFAQKLASNNYFVVLL